METLQIHDVAIVPVIVAATAMATNMGLPKKFAPLFAVTTGVAIGVFYLAAGDVKQGVLVGAAAGFAAVGLYSGTKNTLQK